MDDKEHYLILCEPAIHYWCQRYFVSGYDFDDLRQECRLHLWRKLDQYDPEISMIFTWAKPVIRNHLRDLLKYSQYDKRKISTTAMIMSSCFWETHSE